MRAIFLLVSSLLVWPDVRQALQIPIQAALLIHGEPMGPNITLHREKRAEKVEAAVNCSNDQYKPKRRNFCCNKCHAGYRVALDCSGDGQATMCVPCEEQTFLDKPGHYKRCDQCTSCLPQYGHIELSGCAAHRDTQCGCPRGEYKQNTSTSFLCQKCSRCQNGTQVLECHDFTDTICLCHLGFFLDPSDKSCRPCSQCQGPDCKKHCPDTELVRRPEESDGVLLIVLGVVLAVTVAAVAVYIAYTCYTRRRSSYSDVEVNSGQTSPIISHDNREDHKPTELPGYTYREENYQVTQQSTNQLSDESLPLPDITKGTPPCLNSPKVLYAIIESIPIGRWREFARHLGLSNHIIESCEHDHRYYNEAQYAMLQIWMARAGCSTSKRDQLFNVLEEIKLGGCREKIEEHLPQS